MSFTKFKYDGVVDIKHVVVCESQANFCGNFRQSYEYKAGDC